MGRILGTLLVLLAVIIGISFAVLNARPVEIDYYLGSKELPLALVVVLAFAGGVILGIVGGMLKVAGLARENRRLRRQVHSMEDELMDLRPVSSEDAG